MPTPASTLAPLLGSLGLALAGACASGLAVALALWWLPEVPFAARWILGAALAGAFAPIGLRRLLEPLPGAPDPDAE